MEDIHVKTFTGSRFARALAIVAAAGFLAMPLQTADAQGHGGGGHGGGGHGGGHGGGGGFHGGGGGRGGGGGFRGGGGYHGYAGYRGGGGYGYRGGRGWGWGGGYVGVYPGCYAPYGYCMPAYGYPYYPGY
jgi:hypothetical protein